MAVTLECVACGASTFDCCSGGSTNELFNGIKITDTVTSDVTKIYRPFRVFYSATELNFTDALKNRATVALSDTVYSNINDLLAFVSRCMCSSTGIKINNKIFNSNDDALADGLVAGLDAYVAGDNHKDGHLQDAIVRVY